MSYINTVVVNPRVSKNLLFLFLHLIVWAMKTRGVATDTSNKARGLHLNKWFENLMVVMMVLSMNTILLESPGYVAMPVTWELLIGYYCQKAKTNLTSTVQKVSKASESFSYPLQQTKSNQTFK